MSLRPDRTCYHEVAPRPSGGSAPLRARSLAPRPAYNYSCTHCGVPPGASYSSRRPHGALWALFPLWSAVLPALRSRSRRQEFGSRLRSCIWGGRPRREDPPARKRPASLPCTPCVPQSLPCRPFSHVEHTLAHFWQRIEWLRTSAGLMLTAFPSE